MKKIILILSVFIISCEKENVQPTQEQTQTIEDCNCDRVVSSNKFNLPDGSSFGNYSTVNDCTNQTKDREWSTEYGQTQPVVGECY
jgi:hypothetical protein